MANYNNAANVAVAKPKVGGAVFVAPLGTPVPKNAVDELDSAFVCVGYISEDGVTNSITRSSDNKKAWGGDVVIVDQTEYAESITFTMIETNEASMKIAFGDENVTVDDVTGMHVIHNSAALGAHAYVFETVLGNRIKRQTVENATNVGDMEVASGSDIIGYPVELGLVPGEDGQYAHEWITAIPAAEETPADKAIDDMTVEELKVYAATHGIDLGSATLKADILAAIKAADEIQEDE